MMLRRVARPLTAGALIVAMLRGMPGPAAAGLPEGDTGTAPGGPPLTNEDIVRLVMTGVKEPAILAEIAARPAAFDLRPEVVEEVRRAGVSPAVLDAMRRRQAAMPRPPAPSPGETPGPRGMIEIVFEADPADDTPARRSAVALRALPRGLRRPGGLEVGEYKEMALAVFCTTTDHVPDHWDTHTPLDEALRHDLLLFTPGSGTARDRGFEILYLDLHDPYRVEAPAGRHDIQVVAAGQQSGSGSWRVLASDGVRVVVLEGLTTRVRMRAHSRIRGSNISGFALDTAWTVAGVESPDPAAPPVKHPAAPAPPVAAPGPSPAKEARP